MRILDQIVATQAGRDMLIAHTLETERDAVALLDTLILMLPEGRLRKIATRHRRDEASHVSMLQILAKPLEVHSRTKECWYAMAPQTIGERYATVLIAEERASRNYPRIAEALDRVGAKREASVFLRMAADEGAHIHFCKAILGTLNEPGTAATLDRYREIAKRLEDVPLAVESYGPEHFAEINGWGKPLDPDSLGLGLVIPGVAVGFIDRIGRTNTGYFYGLRANPSLPMITRARGILALADAVIRCARNAGIVRGITSTANGVVERYWVERLGFGKSGETLLEGKL